MSARRPCDDSRRAAAEEERLEAVADELLEQRPDALLGWPARPSVLPVRDPRVTPLGLKHFWVSSA